MSDQDPKDPAGAPNGPAGAPAGDLGHVAIEHPLLRVDGYDEALIGRALVWQPVPGGGAQRVDVLVYDGQKMIESMVQDGCDEAEAIEHISFNVEGAYVGPSTPIIVWPCTMEDVEASCSIQEDTE